jgi:hypothetical protein
MAPILVARSAWARAVVARPARLSASMPPIHSFDFEPCFVLRTNEQT